MKYRLITLFLFCCLSIQAQQTIHWPDNKKCVIILTYDDALISQLDNAVPQLQAAGFKATFFLTGDITYATLPRWRELAKQGFELANHTIFHPCVAADDNPVASDRYTAYGMIREIEEMNRFLFAIDGQTARTFAYPCAETLAGGKDYVDTLRKYNLVKYARIGGDSNAFITDFTKLDPLRIPAYGLEDGTTGDQLIAYVKKVQQSGGMGVIMLHGVGGDYITTSAPAHQQLLDYLKQNQGEIWITTFQDAMDVALKKSK